MIGRGGGGEAHGKNRGQGREEGKKGTGAYGAGKTD